MRRLMKVLAAGAVAALTLSACGGGNDDDKPKDPLAGGGGAGGVVVGSANFPESELLAEIYSQALEAKGVKVTRKFKIGSREVYYSQVTSGGLTVVPEYNGALLTTSVDKNSKAATAEQINAELKAKLPPSVELLDMSQAEDKDSVTVNPQTAQKYKLKSIADLKAVAGQLTIAGPSEFKTRQQGLMGLEQVYGLKFKKFQPFDAGAQTTLVKLMKDNSVQAADLFTTDPAITQNKFVVLEDPKHIFSAQNVVPLVYKSKIDDKGRAALNAVSAKLTTQDLLTMMKRFTIDKDDAAAVAKDWLKQQGLAS